MNISGQKCTEFRIKTIKDSWYLKDPELKLSTGKNIPYVGAGASLKYLCAKISSWVGIGTRSLKDDIERAVQKIQKLPLKPFQKVNLIATYQIPHFLYQMTLAMLPITYLKEVDQSLRVSIKDIYHLPQSTVNGLIIVGKGLVDWASRNLKPSSLLPVCDLG